jgi:hypothetical protein
VDDRSYVQENARELARMRAIAERASDDDLSVAVNEFWTVAAVLGHIAFWDARILSLADKLERGEAFSSGDEEDEDVDWINDASRPFIHAVPARELVRLAVSIADETDARVAGLPVERVWPNDPNSPINALRAAHRGEHLDDVERALAGIDARPAPGGG